MKTENRRVTLILPVTIAVFLVAIIILYGFLTVYYQQLITFILPTGPSSYARLYRKTMAEIQMLIMDTLFTIVGIGLLLSGYRHQKWAGMTIALFVVSFNIVLGLLFQDMWFQIFFGFRKDLTSRDDVGIIAPGARQFWNRHSNVGQSTSSYYSFRLSNLPSKAFLLGMTAWNGRVTLANIIFSLPIFCFLYYFNLYINVLACYSTRNKDRSFDYFDTYGSMMVYLFGSVYGIIAGAFVRKPIQIKQDIQQITISKTSTQFSLLGSFFLLATFCLSFTSILTGYTTSAQSFRFNSKALFVMFGVASGVIGNYVAQLLIGRGQANIQGIIMGTVTGGIIVGGLADVMQNIGAVFFIAFIAGLIAGAFNLLIHNRINRNRIIDSQGLLGPILVVSVIASFIIYPCILHQYYLRNSTLVIRGIGYQQNDYRVARYNLVYFAITLASAAVTGAIMGLIFKIKRKPNRDYSDLKFFIDDYGLYDFNEKEYQGYAPAAQIPTTQNIIKQPQEKQPPSLPMG